MDVIVIILGDFVSTPMLSHSVTLFIIDECSVHNMGSTRVQNGEFESKLNKFSVLVN